MLFGDAPPANPHYPVINGRWDHPVKQQSTRGLFREPSTRLDYSDVDGAHPKPRVDPSIPARVAHDKPAISDRPEHHLFEQPRDINKLVPREGFAATRSFAPREREPSPVRRLFAPGYLRENTKEYGVSVPRIDLSKPVRHPTGCGSPIKSERPELFRAPRETIKYLDLEGARPRRLFDASTAPRDVMGHVFPNSARLFAEPREVMKYQDLEGARAASLDLNKPPKDLFAVCEGSTRKLFQEPRSWAKLPDEEPRFRPGRRRPEEGVEEPRRRLFEEPRPSFKYEDLDGTHPAQFCPANPRKPSATFASTVFS
jgi:hypothetical protein